MSKVEDTFTLRPQDRSRARHWFFTENNPEGALDVLFGELFAEGKIDYATWQLEIGEDGTEHYQVIFLIFFNGLGIR